MQPLAVARNIGKANEDGNLFAGDAEVISSSPAAAPAHPSSGVAAVENSLAVLQLRAGDQGPVQGTRPAGIPGLMDRIEKWGQCVPHTELAGVVADVFVACGLETQQARTAAEILVDAQLGGAPTHGVFSLPMYVEGLRNRSINPRPAMRVSGGEQSCITVDADNALGVLAAQHAIDLLLPAARRHGLAAVAVRCSNHFGLASPFVERAAREGLVCQVTTNASPTMAPFGGTEALLGTNPIATSFPNPAGQPVTVDISASVVARARVRQVHRDGGQLPDHWALDAQGNPTTDPAKALEGTMQPAAGAKGYGMALTAEFTSALAGGRPGFEIASPYKESRDGAGVSHFFLAVDPNRFAGLGPYGNNVAAMVNRIHESQPREPGVPLRVPGERAQAIREQRLREGIPLAPGLLKALSDAVTKVEVSARADHVG
jgi:LDH2 family malate/lactate/ureidoglycolate dehydrogenase